MPITNNPNNKYKKFKEKKDDAAKQTKDNTIPNITEIDGLCKMLGIGKNTAYNLLTSGEIDSFKVGSVWKIPVSSINEYIERKCKETRLVQMYTLVNPNRDLYFDKYHELPIHLK